MTTLIYFLDPLEQFEVLTAFLSTGKFTITNLSIMLFLNLVLYAIFILIFLQKGYTNYHFIIENGYKLVKNIMRENLIIKRNVYFTIVFYLFFVIVFANLIGMIPYSFTVTSSFIVTFFLASMHFIAINLIGTTQVRWEITNLFLPQGVPLAISPFLILIELISYIARVFSLSIRLFANMMSGHALLKILIGFSWALLTSGSVIFIFLSLFPWIIVTLIMFLEVLIAFLQGYVFVILVTIYINDVLNMH